MHLAELEAKYGKQIRVGNRRYKRFIQWPNEVTYGTGRCIRCGQIDEPDFHIREACLEAQEPSNER